MQVVKATYDPSVFDARNIEHAKDIILTTEDDKSTADRWHTETPHLLEIIAKNVSLDSNSLVLDYGCGIGRLSREIIKKFDCWVIGVDISPSMRALAAGWVNSPKFIACAPEFLQSLAVKADFGMAVWVLQHCASPKYDIDLLASRIKPEASLFVLNQKYRCVPCKEYDWVDDKQDVFNLLRSDFSFHSEHDLDPDHVGERIARETKARFFRRNKWAR